MKTYVTFVLDETGSMYSIKDDTIGGFNDYVDTLKKDENEYLFSLVKFDSNGIRKHLGAKEVSSLPISEVPKLSHDNYSPGAMTPLIDACYKAIRATEEAIKGKDITNVAVVIQTDGQENCSRQYTNTDLATLVKAKTEEGWSFTFIGAGMDAFDQASKFGIDQGHTMSYAMDKSAGTFAAAARGTTAYASTGDLHMSEFLQSERDANEDERFKAKRSDTTGDTPKPTPIVDDFSL